MLDMLLRVQEEEYVSTMYFEKRRYNGLAEPMVSANALELALNVAIHSISLVMRAKYNLYFIESDASIGI